MEKSSYILVLLGFKATFNGPFRGSGVNCLCLRSVPVELQGSVSFINEVQRIKYACAYFPDKQATFA
ncbi:hypothetical protein JYU34_004487 [Plutella xylostella]|uniref:Uncharacterized protein n=1 Tax=Plutella xylostella TaxID=51655 RepID=A0ABQ7QY42_PLUXY|nr:hypothetical protein JYU34_004487 [Plutella xylostella]